MIAWNYMVIGLSLLLLIFIFSKEIARKHKRRLLLRLVASFIAVAALACLALPVSILKKIDTATQSNEAVLLTDGFNKDSLEFFLKKNKTGTRLYTQDSLPLTDTSITALHIFGSGLASWEFELINNRSLIFHPSTVNEGIKTIHWQQKLNSGEKLTVQGIFANPSPWPVTVKLEGFQRSLDSMVIPALRTETFEVNTFPKHIGTAVYSLIISDKQGVLEKEPVPVEVEPIDALHILVLAAFPDFENKFLKNWLAENGMSVTTRTLISKNKFDKTFNNTPLFSFDRITNAMLNQFDIIISDASELASLTNAEQAVIHKQVQDNGIGLIVKTDTVTLPSFYTIPLISFSTQVKKYSPVRLYIKDAHQFTSPLTGEAHSYIRVKPGNQPLVLDSAQNVFVSSSLDGAGKIIVTTVKNTYSWMLAGNGKDYSSFWSALLQKAAKKKDAGENFFINRAVPRSGEPIDFFVETFNSISPSSYINNHLLSLHQNAALPFQWQGVYWPEKTGWQTGIDVNHQQHTWYVYEKADWKNISVNEKISQTRQYIKNKNNTVKKTRSINKYARVELPGFYFLLIFIISCSFLWTEKKFSAS